MATANHHQMPPHDKEAEQGVLGTILQNNETFFQVADVLQAESFLSPAHRLIFNAMQALTERQQPIDDITLVSHLRSRGELEKAGGVLYLAELNEAAPVAANAMIYADIVREKYQLRLLIDSAVNIANQGRQDTENVGELIQQAEHVFLELANRSVRRSYHDLKSILQTNFTQLEKAQTLKGKLSGLPTSFAELDTLTNGLQASDFIIVAARPSMGKTSLVMNMAQHIAHHTNQTALIFSLEMSKEQLGKRLLCSHANINTKKMESGRLDQDDWDKLARATSELASTPLFIDDTPEINPLAARAIARRIKSEHSLSLVVVDYLQLMQSQLKHDNREQEIAHISRSLKAMAKDLQVPVIACAQLNRMLETRQNKRPRLSDLRESGSIEQDADLVMFIYRDEVYNPHTEFTGIAELHIAKHRNGPITTNEHGIRLSFMPSRTKFANLSYRES